MYKDEKDGIRGMQKGKVKCIWLEIKSAKKRRNFEKEEMEGET